MIHYWKAPQIAKGLLTPFASARIAAPRAAERRNPMAFHCDSKTFFDISQCFTAGASGTWSCHR